MAPQFDPSQVEIIATDADNTIARQANVFVQVRTGKMTLDALRSLGSTARLLRINTSGNVGILIVLESTAEVVDSSVRDAQREAIASLLSDSRTFMSPVIMGDGVRATLLRSVSRFVAPKMPRLRMASSLAEATTWMAKALENDPPASDLLDLVEHVRTVARRSAAAK